MAIFSGKIIEAYFTNSENNTVEVIYNDGKKAINHYLAVDFTNSDFKDLIEEYNTDKITESTIARNRRYAQQYSDMVDAGIKSKTDLKQKISAKDFVKSLLNFDPNNEECKELLFTLKIQAFDQEKIKASNDNEAKDRIRLAQTPLKLLDEYNKFDD